MTDLAFGISTFNRPKRLEALIESIRLYYKEDYPIHVANHGVKIKVLDDDVQVHRLAYNSGLSSARNYLRQVISNKLIMLLDDDMLIDGRLKLEKLAKILNQRRIHVIAPRIHDGDHNSSWYGKLYWDRDRLLRHDREVTWGDRNRLFGTETIPPGAMLIRREALERVPFDERLKQCEGLEWCLRARRVIKMAVYMKAHIQHVRGREEKSYEEFRDAERERYSQLRDEIISSQKERLT